MTKAAPQKAAFIIMLVGVPGSERPSRPSAPRSPKPPRFFIFLPPAKPPPSPPPPPPPFPFDSRNKESRLRGFLYLGRGAGNRTRSSRTRSARTAGILHPVFFL